MNKLKTAVIRKSNKDKKNLEIKSLKQEIKFLKEEGYQIINLLNKD